MATATAAPARPLEVVLIEDNPAEAALVEGSINESELQRFSVVGFSRLSAAMDHLEREDADCVLLDLSLPDAVGLEGVRALLSAFPDLPVVVLTGHDDTSLALEAVSAGADDFLVKRDAEGDAIVRALRYAIERSRARSELVHQALHDVLTGLPNRALFVNRLEQALARSERIDGLVAVIFLDLDRFKTINDSLGHEAGDRVLVEVAARLHAVVRPGDTLARFGGDEYTVLCEPNSAYQGMAIADRLAVALSVPIESGGHEVFLTASVGIAFGRHGDQPADLIRDADSAMYKAKERGPGEVETFDVEMHAQALQRLEIERDLHRAVERDELRLYWQPIVELDTGDIVAAEALLRWQHPERGVVMPDEFIPAATETGLIVPIGQWVVESACHQLQLWREAGLTEPGFVGSVNASAREIETGQLAESVRGALSRHGVAASELCLEVTERDLMNETGSVLDVVNALHDLGGQLALDDFGTGHSSLLVLKRLPIQTVKVDRAFVRGLDDDDNQDAAIIEAVASLAHALGLSAVAEGIETETQRRKSRELGCDLGQGFLFASPQPAAEMTALLEHRHGRMRLVAGRSG
ncbi:MAG TPA: EAL domain-containing protein [Solirubrobacteraceae bacterium]|jgi:diguanylate cyclase (GGDEF)-like protein|nr:EAL domain-containing protein [Solirubrobacteraceae bacterium]